MKNSALRKATTVIALAVVLFAVCVTTFHHHNPAEQDKHRDCEICSFIYTANNAILTAVIQLWIIAVLTFLKFISKRETTFNIQKVFSSRAPPYSAA